MEDISQRTKTLTRQELYELVWTKPVTTLAKEYNYSDKGLRKICKTHNIPTPNSGHWAKLRHGKSSPRKPLPKNENIIIEIDTSEKEHQRAHPNNQLAKIKNELQNSDLNFMVPDRLSKPHPLVKKACKILNDRKIGWFGKGKDIIYSSDDCLSTEVTKANIPRAMRIWDIMIKLILKRGHKIDDNPSPDFLIFDEEFTIRIREILKRVKVIDSNWDQTEMVSSGIMSIKIHQSYRSYEWRDKKDKPIEDQLINVLTKLEQLALQKKQERIEREAWHKKYKEEEAIQRAREEMVSTEIRKFKKLFETATRWHKSQYLRNYIQEFENYATQTNSLNKEKQNWIEWAQEKADWYDPFVDKEVDLLKDLDRNKI